MNSIYCGVLPDFGEAKLSVEKLTVSMGVDKKQIEEPLLLSDLI